MTQEQIDEATRSTVTAGGKSTDKANRLPGETATEANARLTAAYKELTAKPVLTKEQIDGGMKVQFVREKAGGFGEYVPVIPPGYTGPTKVTNFTPGIVPEGVKYTTGSAVGLDTNGRTIDEYRKVLVGRLTAGNKLTDKESAWLKANGGTSLNPNVTTVKKVTGTTKNADGTITTTWSDGTTTTAPATTDKNVNLKFANGIMYNNGVPFSGTGPDGITYTNGIADDKSTNPADKSLTVGNTTDNTTGNTTTTNPLDTTVADTNKAKRVSAYNTLYDEFNKYGLGTLVSDIKNYLIDNTFDPSEFSIQLQNTQSYQDRFTGNKERIAKGLAALKPAEYIALEDQYQNIMRNYGLPESYWTKGANGVQSGFNQLIANDVDSTELENRLITAQQRVINADPNVLDRLKKFYPDIKNGDILAYTLDPKNALDTIKRKVTAAEIGGAQFGAGLASDVGTAEALGAAGVTGAQYAQATPFISQASQRGSQLSDIYGQSPYDQSSAEAEALNTAGGAQAAAKRKKLTALETASFSGSSGVGALGRDKNIYGAAYGQSGLY